LKACDKKPKSKSTACEKRARKQYGTTGKHAGKKRQKAHGNARK
jgi:hypothetical protein